MSEIIKKSNISIEVGLDKTNHPLMIEWSASDANYDQKKQTTALMLSVWETIDKSALRVDLWTPEMPVNEMMDFYYQIFIGMAKTLDTATHNTELKEKILQFAQEFMNTYYKQENISKP
ncbi:MAG: gliding motility protein GldC [Sediminibacterium sp.]|nr:gliding motility protein GldC [Sediminibacterium sp.]